MKQRRFLNFIMAGLVGLATGMPIKGHADDTEIYTGGSAVEGVRPNILFILDTSGSMDAFDGEPKDRLARMKDALTTLLNGIDNVNIGLMRFTDPGGPILFPVSAIDANADAIAAAGQPDITVQVSADDDDAEELTVRTVAGSAAVNDVKLDSPYLELLSVPAFGSETQVLKPSSSAPGNWDAEQRIGRYDNSRDRLRVGPSSPGRNPRTIGMLFEDFPDDTRKQTNPADPGTDFATVTGARLTFTATDTYSGDLDAKIFGAYLWDAPFGFSASANGPGGCPALPLAPGQVADQDIYCLLGLDTAGEYNAGIDYGNVAGYSHTAGTGLVTDAIVTWDNVPDSQQDQEIQSPDISSVVQEIFNHPFWKFAGGDDEMALFVTGKSSGSRRDFQSNDVTTTRQPRLLVDYVKAGASAGRQTVALRFQNVPLPSFAVVKSAKLQLIPSADSNEPVSIKISAEKVADATPFTAYSGGAAVTSPAYDRPSTRIAARRTTATATWTLTAADTWSHDAPVQSVDISDILKEVSATPGWCGGNDMVIFLEYDTGTTMPRRVYSHDADPSRAASLVIDYDKEDFSPGEGCTTDRVVRRVASDNDDATEYPSFGGVVGLAGLTLPAPYLSVYETLTGIIFRDMAIPPGATITNAVLELASNSSEAANSISLVVKGQKATGSIPAFAASTYNLSNRISGSSGTSATTTVTVPPVNVVRNESFQTSDISPVIQELVNQGDWAQGDDIALFLKPGSGQLDTKSHDSDPARAPALIVNIRYNIGDVLASLPAGGVPGITTVRQRLKEILSTFTHDGYTPIVDTLYEAARYYRGEGVDYGKTRGNGQASVQRNTRLSHGASYTGGTVEYPAGCNTDDSNLSADACRDQRITGNPVYISPIKESCQANFIVLLTDGEANNNHSVSKIQSMANLGSCQSALSDGTTVKAGEECGVDLSTYLFDNDQSDSVAGKNNITTYTIGFNLSGQGISTQFLRDLATASEGQFFEAGSESSLLSVFQAIFADVLSRSTSFAAPSLSVNAFNRLEDRNEVYFSLFEPSPNVAWNGNIKKFQLCRSEQDECHTVSHAEVGDILDSQNPAVVAVGGDGRILDTAISFWTNSADGPEVLKGGAGSKVPDHDERRVFTTTDDKLASGAPTDTVTFYPSSVDLSATKNRIVDVNGDGILDGLSGTAAENLAQTRRLLGMSSATTSELSDQINWIRGKDVDQKFDDAKYGENRWRFGDPLHGNPLAITFGGTEATPIIKLVAGTNDGGVRLINSNTGEEEWIFIPTELLPLQEELRDNPIKAQRDYGMDGTATPWIRDVGDEIGVIEPLKGDFVRIFMGMRRGGNSYYALDITPTAKIAQNDTTTLTNISPKVMWRIRGGTAEFPMLGETWSRPVLATMLLGTTTAGEAERRTVLIFAGGYDPASQDGDYAKTNAATGVGNAIYVVDASTGKRLFFVGGPNAISRHTSTPVKGIEVADMEFPIPSDVAAFDADGDGSVDRLYVGDTGGQMWRVDFFPNRAGGTGNDGLTAIAGKLASVAFEPADADHLPDAPADARKFFYPPSIIQVRGAGSQSNEDYDLISAVTGNRASPLDLNVRDRFYAFRDYNTGHFLDADGNGLADGYTTIRGDLDGAPDANPPVNPKTFSEMLDFTILDGPQDLPDPSDFVTSSGYFLRLDTGGAGNGEKGLAAPTTLAGKLFFTTYLPQAVVDTDKCTLAEGRGQLYGINAITGAAIFNWDTPSDPTIDRHDRTYALGAGIPSNPVPVFFPEKVMLLIGVGGGAETVDPNITVPQGRTYWFQQ